MSDEKPRINPHELLLAGPDLCEPEEMDLLRENAPQVRRDVEELLRKHGLIQVLMVIGPTVEFMISGMDILSEEMPGSIVVPNGARQWKPVLMDVMEGIAKLQHVIKRGESMGVWQRLREMFERARN